MGKRKVILYSADWCQPCQELKEVINDVINTEKLTDVELVVVDVEKHSDIGIYVVPKTCLIEIGEDKCEGILNCLDGGSSDNTDKILNFVRGNK